MKKSLSITVTSAYKAIVSSAIRPAAFTLTNKNQRLISRYHRESQILKINKQFHNNMSPFFLFINGQKMYILFEGIWA